MKTVYLALALLAALPAEALAQETPASVRISYADLDLGTAEGVNTLKNRLAWAIAAVCSKFDSTAIVERQFAARRCVQKKTAEMAAVRDHVIAAHAARSINAGHAR